jgi:hypothetical protein
MEEFGASQQRDITRVDGAGGEFVPPLWLVSDYAEMIRAGRVTANLVRSIPLPGGTDSINIPRITTGTSAAPQTADNGAVSETDIVTTSVAAPVRTIAGQQDIALQLLEQSPLVTRRIPMLFPLANIATLFGLIGTISGLIKSFSALSSASPEQKAQILAIGISEAMYNTAFGLLIAVVCIAAQLFLANKAKGMIEEVEFNALKLENLLARRAAGDLEPAERASA